MKNVMAFCCSVAIAASAAFVAATPAQAWGLRAYGYAPWGYSYAYAPGGYRHAYAYRPYRYAYVRPRVRIYRPYAYAYAYRPYAYSYAYRPYAYSYAGYPYRSYAYGGFGPRIWIGWGRRGWR